MAEPKTDDKPAEDNRSPETEEAADLDLEAVAEAVVEKLKPLLAGSAPGPAGDTEEGKAHEGGPETEGGDGASQTPSVSEPPSPPASSSDGGSLDEKIAAGVAKALGDKDHEAQHAAMAPAERPPRKGLGRLVWGP